MAEHGAPREDLEAELEAAREEIARLRAAAAGAGGASAAPAPPSLGAWLWKYRPYAGMCVRATPRRRAGRIAAAPPLSSPPPSLPHPPDDRA